MLAGYQQRLASAAALVETDRASLQRIRPGLYSSILTLPEQAAINRDQPRVDADLTGVQAQLSSTGASLQKAVDLAKPPTIPADFGPLLKAMQQAVTDLQALVAAGQANDQAAFNKASTRSTWTVKAVSGFDQTARGGGGPAAAPTGRARHRGGWRHPQG